MEIEERARGGMEWGQWVEGVLRGRESGKGGLGVEILERLLGFGKRAS